MSTIVGGSGDNTLTGTSGSDTLVGGSGSDYIDGGTGADKINAGAGNDTIVYDINDISVNGASGFDTLLVTGSGQTVYLVDTSYFGSSPELGPDLKSIELVDLNGTGANTLIIDEAGLASATTGGTNTLAGTQKTMIVRLGQDDTVSMVGNYWIQGSAVTLSDHILYHVYTNADTTLLVQNRAVVAVNDTVSMNANASPVTLNVLGNDHDPDGDAMSVLSLSPTAHGGLASIVSGQVVYDANHAFDNLFFGQTATDTFTYTVKDSLGALSTATVTVTITGIGHPTVANADFGSVVEDLAPSTIGNVLTNDIQAGQTLSVTTVGTFNSAFGSLILSSNGSYTYVLNNGAPAVQSLAAGVTQTDVFNYTISDGHGGTASSTLTITITGTNDAAVIAGADTGAVKEDVNVDVSGNLVAAGVLTVNDPDTGQSSFQAGVINGTYGSLTLDAAGHWSYSANNSQPVIQALPEGATATDAIVVHSLDGTAHTITITLTGTNDAAVFSGIDTGAVKEDVNVVSGNLVASGALAVSDVDTGQSSFQANTFTGTYGSLSLDAAGHWNYSANNSQPSIQSLAEGATATDVFTVHSLDGTAHAVTITLTGTNDAAIFSGAGIGSVKEDVNVDGSGNLVASGNMVVTDIDTGQSSFQAGVINGTYGSLTLDAAGHWSYSANNSQPSIQSLGEGVTVTDAFTVHSLDGTARAITITLTGTNDAPVAVNDGEIAQTNQNTSLTLAPSTVLGNDTDPDNGHVLSISSVSGDPHVSLDGGGNIVFAPGTDYAYLAAGDIANVNFTYIAKDEFGALSGPASASIRVNGLNDAPTAVNDGEIAQTDQNTSLTLSPSTVLSNDTDPDFGHILSIASVSGDSHVTLDGGGNIVFTPGTDYAYLSAGDVTFVDFTYIAKDEFGALSGPASASIQVTGVNDAPTAVDDGPIGQADQNTVLTLAPSTVLSNDTDPDTGHVLSISSLVSGNPHITLDGGGNIVFTPGTDYAYLSAGDVTFVDFTYIAQDEFGALSGPASATIQVTGLNDAPVAVVDTFIVNDSPSGSFVVGNVLANDTDIDIGTHLSILSTSNLSVTLPPEYASLGGVTVVQTSPNNYDLVFFNGAYESAPAHLNIMANGDVVLTKNDAMQFLPNGESLNISFNYTATDGALTSNSTAAITVTGTDNNDIFVATHPIQILTADSGHDTLIDKAPPGSNITMVSGTGNDTFIARAGNHDTLSYANLTHAPGVTVDLGQVAPQDVFGNGSKLDIIQGTFQTLIGSAFNDTLSDTQTVVGVSGGNVGGSAITNISSKTIEGGGGTDALILSATAQGGGGVTGGRATATLGGTTSALGNILMVDGDNSSITLTSNATGGDSTNGINTTNGLATGQISHNTLTVGNGTHDTVNLVATARGGNVQGSFASASYASNISGFASIDNNTLNIGNGDNHITLDAIAMGGSSLHSSQGFGTFASGNVLAVSAEANVSYNTLTLGNGYNVVMFEATATGGGSNQYANFAQSGGTAISAMASLSHDSISGEGALSMVATATGGNGGVYASFTFGSTVVSAEANVTDNIIYAVSGSGTISASATGGNGSYYVDGQTTTGGGNANSAIVNVTDNSITVLNGDGFISANAMGGNGFQANNVFGSHGTSAEADVTNNTIHVESGNGTISANATGGTGANLANYADNQTTGVLGTATSAKVIMTNNILDGSAGTGPETLSLLVTATPGVGNNAGHVVLDNITVTGNQLLGGSGNDTLNLTVTANRALSGDPISIQNNILYGGVGDDTLIFNVTAPNSPTLTNLTSSGNELVAGSGADILTDASTVQTNLTMLSGTGNDTFTASAINHDTLSYANAIHGVTLNLGLTSPQDVFGDGSKYDTINGTFTTLIGSAYDDILKSTNGNHTFIGGDGNDTVSYENVSAGVSVTLHPSVSYEIFKLPAAVSTIPDFSTLGAPVASGVENNFDINIRPVGLDDLFAARFNSTIDIVKDGNYIFTLRSDDGGGIYIDGQPVAVFAAPRGAADTNGTVHLTSGQHTIQVLYYEDGGGQELKISYNGPDTGNVKTEVFGNDTLINIENLTGSPFADTLIGDDQNNVINGGGGNDLIKGGAGDDTLIGGGGNDIISGGAGKDTMIFDNLAFLTPGSGSVMDGGTDFNTLIFAQNNGSLNLTTVDATTFKNIDLINMTAHGTNTFIVSASEVLAMTHTAGADARTLFVQGDVSVDTVNITGWTFVGTATDGQGDGITYVSYANGTATLNIEGGLNGVPTLLVAQQTPDQHLYSGQPGINLSLASAFTEVGSGASINSYAIVAGFLPAGLTLDPATGLVSGQPAVNVAVPNETIMVRAMDSLGNIATESFILSVTDPLSLSATPTPDQHFYSGQPGVNLSLASAFNEVGQGISISSYAIVAGSLPAGLSLDPMTGVISGNVAANITSGATIGITATDSFGNTETEIFIESVTDPLSVVQTANQSINAEGVVNFSVATAFIDSNPLTYTVTDNGGALPSWLSFSSNGVFSGTAPVTSETDHIIVTATDSWGNTATDSFTLSVLPLPIVSLGNGTVGNTTTFDHSADTTPFQFNGGLGAAGGNGVGTANGANSSYIIDSSNFVVDVIFGGHGGNGGLGGHGSNAIANVRTQSGVDTGAGGSDGSNGGTGGSSTYLIQAGNHDTIIHGGTAGNGGAGGLGGLDATGHTGGTGGTGGNSYYEVYGGAGNDTIYIGSGGSVGLSPTGEGVFHPGAGGQSFYDVAGGGGNNTIIASTQGIFNGLTIDGGTGGLNTLQWNSAANLDLSANGNVAASQIHNVDVLDFGSAAAQNHANQLTLNVTDVLDIGHGSSTLFVKGDANVDNVHFADAPSWSDSGPVIVSGVSYEQYTQGTAHVDIQSGVHLV
jgi:VCBS repeat-containing protein